mmetsp:Transcript_36301/g.95102  ORF Transcript_36301/g.95102 Transcript_36301/m.95102 type:complete len:278 (+) Transcript_36301:25-858(+)
MSFGQVVVGPPGSGKSTYCLAMQRFLENCGRKVAIISLDPANDGVNPAIDIRDLVRLADVTERMGLGPNGGLIFCIEYLASNVDWLKGEIDALDEGMYLIFDCPGQVELYTHHEAMRSMLATMTVEWGLRLCATHLVDSLHCTDPNKYVAGLMASLSTMLQLELPHVNVMSKADLLEQHEEALDFPLEFYTEVMDMSFLSTALEADPFGARFAKLNAAIAELVEDFGLVQFHTLNVNDPESLARVAAVVDKALGYVIGPDESREPKFQPAEPSGAGS